MPKYSLYGIYDMREEEQCVYLLESAREVAEKMGIAECTVYSNVCRGHLIKNRYKIVKLD